MSMRSSYNFIQRVFYGTLYLEQKKISHFPCCLIRSIISIHLIQKIYFIKSVQCMIDGVFWNVQTLTNEMLTVKLHKLHHKCLTHNGKNDYIVFYKNHSLCLTVTIVSGFLIYVNNTDCNEYPTRYCNTPPLSSCVSQFCERMCAIFPSREFGNCSMKSHANHIDALFTACGNLRQIISATSSLLENKSK